MDILARDPGPARPPGAGQRTLTCPGLRSSADALCLARRMPSVFLRALCQEPPSWAAGLAAHLPQSLFPTWPGIPRTFPGSLGLLEPGPASPAGSQSPQWTPGWPSRPSPPCRPLVAPSRPHPSTEPLLTTRPHPCSTPGALSVSCSGSDPSPSPGGPRAVPILLSAGPRTQHQEFTSCIHSTNTCEGRAGFSAAVRVVGDTKAARPLGVTHRLLP